MKKKLFHDYETFSELDLKKVGAYKYAMHPSTRVLMAAWAVDDGPIFHWDESMSTRGGLDRLQELLVDPEIEKSAFNAMFEFLIAKFVMKVDVKIEEFYCTMVHAWSLSFSGGLDMVGTQMGIPQDKAKLSTGKKLIQKFCKRAPSNHIAPYYDYTSDPEKWDEFVLYDIQDVVAEREIAALLTPYPIIQAERDLWILDAKINLRGVPVDRELIDAALEVAQIEKHALKERLIELTGLDNPNSKPQMKGWLNENGCHLEDMQKDTLKMELKALEEEVLDGAKELSLTHDAIELSLQLSMTSTSKWVAFAGAIMDDDRLRGMFAFGAAQRTGRWSGRLVQLMNLPSGVFDDPRWIADILLMCGHRTLAKHFAPVMSVLSSTIRCAITAPEGYSLVVADLAGIESRVLGYMSGCKKINAIFAEGKDVYKAFAVEATKKPYDEITKKERKFYKAPALGCFAGDTKVLTKSKWKSIADVKLTDLLWDGVEWVGHGGVVDQGVKECENLSGVRATSDHRILVESTWVPWGEVHKVECIRDAVIPLPAYRGAPKIDKTHHHDVYLEQTYDILNAGPRNRYTILTDKGPVIAHNCGYMLGWKGLIGYAEGFGTIMTEKEAKHCVKAFRDGYPEIKAMWYWMVEACTDVIVEGISKTGYGVHITRDHNFMFIELPSGRKIAYYQPLVIEKVPPWEADKQKERQAEIDAAILAGEDAPEEYIPQTRPTISYMGMDQYSKKWKRITTHSGKLVENIIQSFARDIQAVWMTRIEHREVPVVLHVHDEVGGIVPEAEGEDKLVMMIDAAREPMPWAPDLLLDAAGYVTKRYYKD